LNAFDGIEYFKHYKERDVFDLLRAREILKSLRNEYPKLNRDIQPSKKPLSGHAWDYFTLINQVQEFPQFQIGLNKDSFYINTMIKGDKLKLILNNMDEFIIILRDLKDNPEYYLEMVDWGVINNMREFKHTVKGDGYTTFNFTVQLKKMATNTNWEEWLKNILLLMGNSKFKKKNFQVYKKYYYSDSYYHEKPKNSNENSINMNSREICLNEIAKAINELLPLYKFFQKLV
jgi:hypothetical protein